MTVLDTAPTPVAAPVAAPPPAAPGRLVRRRLVAGGLVGLFLLVILIAAFNGPVAGVWYQSRQRQLAHDYGVARPHVRPGQAVAILQIPVINLNLVVGEGDSPSQLRAGPGYRVGTPVPGNLGNSLIFGHRHGWGGSFANLGKLGKGDEIIVQPKLGQPTLFVVTSVVTVAQNDTKLLANSTDHRLTLVTGTGGGLFSTRRLVVTAVSGTVGQLQHPRKAVAASGAHGSPIFNGTVGLLVLLVLVGAAAAKGLGARYRPVTAAMILAPLAVSVFVALMLELDLLLPGLH